MKHARGLILALGLSLALPFTGCATAPSIQQAFAPEEQAFAPGEPAPGGAYHAQQGYPYMTFQARQRIRTVLEKGYPDYSPSVQALNVWPIIPGQRYRFRARVTVIGIAGPSVPLRYLVEGTYDRRTGKVVETSRTPITRP